MSADTNTLTRQGDRWFAIDEETGVTASGRTREQALESLDAAIAGGATDDRDEVAIVRPPDVLHGKPRIDGTRLGVFSIGESARRGSQSVEELLDASPDVTTEQIEAALAYYDGHPDEMAALRDEAEQLLRGLREQSRAP